MGAGRRRRRVQASGGDGTHRRVSADDAIDQPRDASTRGSGNSSFELLLLFQREWCAPRADGHRDRGERREAAHCE